MPSVPIDRVFVSKHQDKVHGVLSCFDRIIFRGHLPLSYAGGLEGFLYQQGVLLKNFRHYAPQVAERIKEHIKGIVASAGAPFRHLPRKEAMEEQARRLAQEQNIREGIVCGFSQLETCGTFRCESSGGRLRLRKDYRRCSVYYVFLMHAVFGLIHVKIHGWFPLTMQVYVNGHDFLARKLDQLGVAYTLYDNAFTWIADLPAAQACADQLLKVKLPRVLGQLARQFNPLLNVELRGKDYYWVIDQAEYATDVLFQDAEALAGLYPRLVEHARACFTAEDVFRFLGRTLTGHFKGEVHTRVKRRPEGVRVSHHLKSNRLKMYDKGGRVLRIETTINQPRDFRVRRRDRQGQLRWQPLCKGVAWLWRYAAISQASNFRYLAALAVVDDDSGVRRLVDRATRSVPWRGRRKRGLQPLSTEEQALFLAVLRGEHRLRGFRNQDLVSRLYTKPSRDPRERRRRAARVTRQIQLLRAHGLLAKIPRSRRYRVTAAGEKFMSAAIRVKEQYLPAESAAVA
jgi:hypothetical protein